MRTEHDDVRRYLRYWNKDLKTLRKVPACQKYLHCIQTKYSTFTVEHNGRLGIYINIRKGLWNLQIENVEPQNQYQSKKSVRKISIIKYLFIILKIQDGGIFRASGYVWPFCKHLCTNLCQPASQQTKIEICAQRVTITTLPPLWTIPWQDST